MAQITNTFEYSVDPENIDFKGQIKVPALYGHIINAISHNVRKEGYGVEVMARANRGWVLIRSALEIDVRPTLYSPIYVTVWPVPGNGITYNRCVKVVDGAGNELGRGTTEWCIIDRESRKPIFPELEVGSIPLGIPCRSPRRIRDFAPELTDDRKISYSDCDFNGHLNNTRYVDMMYDMLPECVIDASAPVRLDVNYRHEARKGELLSLGLKQEKSDEYLFMARSEGQTLCSAALMTA